MKHRNSLPRIVVPQSDHERLMALAESAPDGDSSVAGYLIRELGRAHVVPDADVADRIVRMGSRVTYRDDASGQVRTVTLVYPRLADMAQGRISVLTPIGAAVLGMSPAQSIDWPSPQGGSRMLTVLGVQSEETSDACSVA